jgi:hypothetical protein
MKLKLFETILYIKWEDSQSRESWTDKDNINSDLDVVIAESVGFYMGENDNNILIGQSHTRDLVCMTTLIPKKNIVEIKEIKMK